MAENSLFAILLRSPWWISLGIAAAIALGAVALLPDAWKWYGAFAAAPFVVIAAIAGWRQLRAPGAATIERKLTEVRAMTASQFAQAIEQRLRADGFSVTPVSHAEVDFEARRASRLTLVGCRRFKAARAGIRPLQDLQAAMQAREADDAMYFAVGELTDQARQFATRSRIRVVQGADLGAWLSSSR
jgi:restriction system protein